MNFKSKQNKNASIENEDVLAGPLVDEIPLPDTCLHNSISVNSVKSEEKIEEKLPMTVPVRELPKTNLLEIVCPYCASANAVKRGIRKKKRETVQLYLCRDCRRTFTPGAVKGKHYGLATILDAMSLYYLGYSLEKACKIAGVIDQENRDKKQKTTSENSEMTFVASTGASTGFVNPEISIADREAGNKKSALMADSLEFQDDPVNSALTSKSSITHQNNLSSDQEKTKQIVGGSAGDRTPETLMSRQSSDHPGPTVALLYQEKNKSAKIGAGTLLNWLNQYHGLCAFSRMREFAVKMFKPEEMIVSATLAHRQLYRFRYHRAKTPLIIRADIKHARFWPLKEFLELAPAECPHQYFQAGERASEAPIAFSKTEMIVRAKHNYACELAKFVLPAAKEAKDRHDLLQRFMLANDSVTVATEVPVYIRKEDLTHMRTQLGFQLFKKAETKKSVRPAQLDSGSKAGMTKLNDYELLPDEEIPKLITGHIDFLQIRNGYIHILDYKPHAARDRPLEQLTLYALALSRLTGLRVFNFKCAWFDEKDYFEFFPLHVVYKPGKKRRRVKTREGIYEVNDNPRRVEKLKPP